MRTIRRCFEPRLQEREEKRSLIASSGAKSDLTFKTLIRSSMVAVLAVLVELCPPLQIAKPVESILSQTHLIENRFTTSMVRNVVHPRWPQVSGACLLLIVKVNSFTLPSIYPVMMHYWYSATRSYISPIKMDQKTKSGYHQVSVKFLMKKPFCWLTSKPHQKMTWYWTNTPLSHSIQDRFDPFLSVYVMCNDIRLTGW